MTYFKSLYDYCEGELDFEVTLSLATKPARDSGGKLKSATASDSRLMIEIFNKHGHKVVQVRQANSETIDKMAQTAWGYLADKGFGPEKAAA